MVFRFRPLTLGDVLRRADHLDDVARLVQDNVSVSLQNTLVTIRPDNSNVEPGRFFVRNYCVDPLDRVLSKVGMNARQIKIVGHRAFPRRKSEEATFLVRPEQCVRDHIPFPTAHTRHSLRFRQPCFAAFEFFLCLLALDGQGDLISHGGEELQVALGVSTLFLVVLHGQYADGARGSPQGHAQPRSGI